MAKIAADYINEGRALYASSKDKTTPFPHAKSWQQKAVNQGFQEAFEEAADANHEAIQQPRNEAAQSVTRDNLQVGGRYNWKGQPERLVYMGLCEPRNGRWHQFAKVDSPDVCWSEVTDADLASFEATPLAPAVEAVLVDIPSPVDEVGHPIAGQHAGHRTITITPVTAKTVREGMPEATAAHVARLETEADNELEGPRRDRLLAKAAKLRCKWAERAAFA